MKAIRGLIIALLVFALTATTASAYFGCISGVDNAVCFNKGISCILGDDIKTFNVYQADLSGFGYTAEKAEIQFTVKNPSNISVGVKYGINGNWYQTVLVKAGDTSTIKSNVDLNDLKLGQRNEVTFKTTTEIEEELPIKGHLAVRWTRDLAVDEAG